MPAHTIVQRIGSWNIEGLPEGNLTKLHQIIHYMQNGNLAVLCLQETHRPRSEYFLIEKGYLLILSGGPMTQKENAGVGFLVAPWALYAMKTFWQFNNRMAAITIRVRGGSYSIISAYSPHAGYNYDIRREFFSHLIDFTRKQKPYRPVIIFGDLNARIHYRKEDEHDVLGPYILERLDSVYDPLSNRELLMEQCRALGYQVCNTFLESSMERQVTYYNLVTKPMDEVNSKDFGQLDLSLCPERWIHLMSGIASIMEYRLQSHHFLVTASILLEIPKKEKTIDPKVNWKSLKDPEIKRNLCTEFMTRRQDQISITNYPGDIDRFTDQFSEDLHKAVMNTLRKKIVSDGLMNLSK